MSFEQSAELMTSPALARCLFLCCVILDRSFGSKIPTGDIRKQSASTTYVRKIIICFFNFRCISQNSWPLVLDNRNGTENQSIHTYNQEIVESLYTIMPFLIFAFYQIFIFWVIYTSLCVINNKLRNCYLDK